MICMYTPTVIATIHTIESLYLRNELFCDVKHQQAQWTPLSCLKFDHKKSSNDMQPCYVSPLIELRNFWSWMESKRRMIAALVLCPISRPSQKPWGKDVVWTLDTAQHAHRTGKELEHLRSQRSHDFLSYLSNTYPFAGNLSNPPTFCRYFMLDTA